jgi:Fic family protein
VRGGRSTATLLYLSLYLKSNRSEYYDSLQRVRTTGDWEQWLRFFLTGVRDVAAQAAQTSRRLLILFDADRHRIQEKLGRGAASALRVHDTLMRKPVLSIPRASTDLGLSQPTVAAALARLQELDIVRELTNKARNRQFSYVAYFAMLDEGMSGPTAGH